VNFELSVARTGKTILELRDLSVAIADTCLVEGLTLYLTQGDRLGIVGKNGSGKTTLLRTLLGEIEPRSGSVVLGKNTRVAYFDQLRSGLDPDKSVFDNVAGDQSRIEVAGEVVEPRSYLERFGFRGADQRKKVAALSGGERARVAMARMLRQSANLVVMDEPTNDLDVATLAALEGLLVEMQVTALVVTHDRWFLDRVATDILAFEGDRRVVRYPGNYSSFRKLKADAAAREPRAAPAPKTTESATAEAPPERAKKLSFSEKQELAALPDAIAALENQVAELNAKLADPATYTDGSIDPAALGRSLEQLRAEVDQRTERWLELEQRAD
jgi:ATP-binding cassette subfamily F protein uup